jgi:hypothetical protein
MTGGKYGQVRWKGKHYMSRKIWWGGDTLDFFLQPQYSHADT